MSENSLICPSVSPAWNDVLHDEDPDRDPPVQDLQLATVGQQLDHDDGRGERHRHREIAGVTTPNPKAVAIAKASNAVSTIWPRPAPSATGPSTRMTRTSSLRPTTKSSTAMPNSITLGVPVRRW
jgi:hypothetical protein